MLIPRFRTSLILNKSLIGSTSAATHVAFFHSTPASCDKWKNNWRFDGEKGKEPSKNYVRYVTRQRRADAKKALKDLLYNNGSTFQNKESKWSLGGRWSTEESSDQSGSCDKKERAKSSMRHMGKSQHKKTKRKFRRESFYDDFDNDSETVFHTRFGNRSYAWSFGSCKESSENSAFGFEWTQPPNWKNRRAAEWDNSSDCESDEETTDVGSCSDRTILGLPQKGPLKIEDVKTAFRLSALKWHPDKHQGSSQAIAEEKFKLCVNAYNSLCCALSPG
ncbi:uncharacterized protein LOC111024907 [Momordica charantia]|uniref:Uncharacterized protein LOC111024907 n=1 Tax=Momordica charantia TaxID=3673 RepID=A0A6J1E0U6_MOMCH|nr:uncharacterized protein LOC111024907 [Momordica charantia]